MQLSTIVRSADALAASIKNRFLALTNTRFWTVVRWAVLAFLLVACALQSAEIFHRTSVELHMTVWDFLVPGRAILNGFIPYQDHLDVKAPGTVFIGALSLLVTGDGRFEQILMILMMLSVPLLMAIGTHKKTKQLHWFKHWSLVACAFSLGCEFTIYAFERGDFNGSNAEPYGLFFALLYLLVILWDQQNMSYLRLALASVFMLCAIGIKEPFLFILLAMNLLLFNDVRQLFRSFVVPLVISTILGTLLLGCFGYLMAYLMVDIPTILADRVVSSTSFNVPLFGRGFMIDYIVQGVTKFSPVPMMGYAIFSLWALHPLFKFRERIWLLLLAVGTIILAAWSSNLFFLHQQIIRLMGDHSLASDALPPSLTVKLICSLIALAVVLLLLGYYSRKLFFGVLFSVVAVYLTIFAIGSGHFLAQHFLLAVPVYAAVFFLFAENPRFLLPIVLFGLMPFYHTRVDYDKKLQAAMQAAENRAALTPLAIKADELLSACHFDQYQALGVATSIFNQTRHSPTDMSYAETSDNPALRERYRERLRKAPVIFTDKDYLQQVEDDDIAAVLKTDFTTEAPVCAQTTSVTAPFVLLFRRDGASAGPAPELHGMPLSHYIADLTAQSITDRQGLRILSAIRRELNLPEATDLRISLERKAQTITITALDATGQNILGTITLNTTDGSVLSKSPPAP